MYSLIFRGCRGQIRKEHIPVTLDDWIRIDAVDVQEIQDLTLAAPKSNKVFEVLQVEVL